jgi:hypothetical protein
MKHFLVLGLLIGMSTVASAQALGRTYKTAVGLKFYPTGITVKHFVKSNAALEGIAYFWNDGVRITGLYEYHGNINGAPGLKWYIGPGAHIGFWNEHYWDNRHWDDDDDDRTNTYIGVDGVLGLDYKINKAPINLSLDWQPSISFGRGYTDADAHFGGIAIRFAF